ncbi:MAG TPA: YetF domain-containing protein [Candidatus Dormibacteraeota bacterium]|nr:YetF domain-containing protein [Candidatus Dormibacteraeota bacterium]
MFGDMFKLGVPPLELVARTIIVYLMFLAALRIFGKREIGQFTIFDLALVLLAANALQPAITGPDQSVTGALIIIVTVFVLNWSVGLLRSRVPAIRRLLEQEPTVVGRDGHWIPEAVDREGLDDLDLGAALREHGLADVSEMKLAVLEEDGSISVVPVDDGQPGHQVRRRRYRRRANI